MFSATDLLCLVALALGVTSSPTPDAKPKPEGFSLPYRFGDEKAPYAHNLVERASANPGGIGFNNRMWVTLGIGNPPQWLNFLTDTGANDFSVCSTLAPNNGASLGDQPKYDPSKSNTAYEMKGVGFTDNIAAVSYTGVVYSEIVQLADQTFYNIPIQVITGGPASYGDRAGNLGLDKNFYLSTNSSKPLPAFIQAIKDQLPSKRAIHAHHFDNYLNQGGVDFGFVNTSLYSGPLQYHACGSDTEWRLFYDGVVVNGKLTKVQIEAIHDFGGGDSSLPRVALDAYFSTISGARYSGNTYYFDCASNLPAFGFAIGGQYLFIPKESWVRGALGQSGYTCSSRFTDSGAAYGFMGQSFLTGVYTVFDQDYNQLGLANRPNQIYSHISDIAPQNGAITFCHGANFTGGCAPSSGSGSLSFIATECSSLTGSAWYHAARSFASTAASCVLYKDTACTSPLLSTPNSYNLDIGSSAATQVGSYMCSNPGTLPPRGSGTLKLYSLPGGAGTPTQITWNSYECHNLPTNIVGTIKYITSQPNSYCYMYTQANCKGAIGSGIPYNQPNMDYLPVATSMKSFLCY